MKPVLPAIFILHLFLLNIFPVNPLYSDYLTIVNSGSKTTVLLREPLNFNDGSFIKFTVSGTGLINLESSIDKKKLHFDTGIHPQDIYIYKNLAGFNPESIYIEKQGAGFDLYSAEIGQQNGNSPIPADIGHIIFSEFPDDKDRSWEIYRWNLVPEILIYDTADYSVQSRIFKRLAFFVEKPGYAGRLVPNEELEGKHGWNAHDYKPDDLAEFFTKAEAENFRLNEEEISLRKTLIGHNIITDNGGGLYSGEKGAVLSVSRQTPANWRYRFLTHECLHGLFFTSNEYKSEIFNAFYELNDDELEFWKRLLDYRRYDVSNEYLLVNEFMAFSLQQPAEEVNEYFKGFLYKRMIAARPYEEDFVESFDSNYGNSFVNSVSKLENILYNHTGRIAGHLANIYPVEIKESFFDLFPSL